MMKSKILVVDDEADALQLLQFNLKNAGFKVITSKTGEDALMKARVQHPDLVVLDVMLPGIDGLQICKMLKNDGRTAAIPVVMVTARATEIDRVVGLELGADDYLTKPFSPRELVLRVSRLLKIEHLPTNTSEQLAYDDLIIDLAQHQVTVCGKPVSLTATEFKLLTLLAQRAGRVQSRDQLLHEVWDYDSSVESRTVDTHMRRLRFKLGRAARHPEPFAVSGRASTQPSLGTRDILFCLPLARWRLRPPLLPAPARGLTAHPVCVPRQYRPLREQNPDTPDSTLRPAVRPRRAQVAFYPARSRDPSGTSTKSRMSFSYMPKFLFFVPSANRESRPFERALIPTCSRRAALLCELRFHRSNSIGSAAQN
jgi:DNA-binding response OmpR family regulator